MANYNLMDRIRSFFGMSQQPPRNDFRNPIWGSDDEDDEDELYTRANLDDPVAFQRELSRQLEEVFRSFSNMFGDLSSLFEDITPPSQWQGAIMDVPTEPEEGFNNNNIRDYYLRPGYQNEKQDYKDVDLDGKVSSDDISGLLKQKEEGQIVPVTPFDGNLVPGRLFCQTIITTSVTKPDGTVETRRIVKKGNDIVEETITTTEPTQGPYNGPSPISTPSFVFSSLSSMFRNFY